VYDAIRAAVRLDEGRWTPNGLARHLTMSGLGRGMAEVALANRVRLLVAGGTLERRVNPERKGGRSRLWMAVDPPSTEDALHVAAMAETASRVRDARDGAATPHTGRSARGDGGARAAAEHEAWVDANWSNFTGPEQRYWNFERHDREAQRAGTKGAVPSAMLPREGGRRGGDALVENYLRANPEAFR
jgi:hypothetical protein